MKTEKQIAREKQKDSIAKKRRDKQVAAERIKRARELKRQELT